MDCGGLPWVIEGDFNEILCPKYKTDGVDRRASTMYDFTMCLDDCNLHDMRW